MTKAPAAFFIAVGNRQFQRLLKGMSAQNADIQGRVGVRETALGLFDKFSETIQIYRLNLILTEFGHLLGKCSVLP